MFSRINGSGSTNHVTTSNMIFTTQTDPASTIDPKLQVLRDPEYAELLTRHSEERIYAHFMDGMCVSHSYSGPLCGLLV